jgi:hypothetical protein
VILGEAYRLPKYFQSSSTIDRSGQDFVARLSRNEGKLPLPSVGDEIVNRITNRRNGERAKDRSNISSLAVFFLIPRNSPAARFD